MRKNFIFIANWKMYLNFNEEIDLITSNYDAFISLTNTQNNKIILCPSLLSLATITQIFKTTKIETGGQNCSAHNKGSFTGQILAESLNLIGAKYCIIGHSEYRKYFNENEKNITQKIYHLINNKITPVLCIGETKEEYKNNKTLTILKKQLEPLKTISLKTNMIIAYEPIWSIGTGTAANIDHLEYIFTWLNKEKQKYSENINLKIIYGGSINHKNIINLKKIRNLNGFLIGRASLDFQELKKIVKSN